MKTAGSSEMLVPIYQTIKINLSMCLITYASYQEDLRRSGGMAPLFLTSALDVGEWSDSRPGRFTRKKSRPYPLDMRLSGLKELVWTLWRREKTCLSRKSKRGLPARSTSLYSYIQEHCNCDPRLLSFSLDLYIFICTLFSNDVLASKHETTLRTNMAKLWHMFMST
jgi:hypothetical protein